MRLNLDKSTWKRVAFGDVIDSITDRVDDPSMAGVDRYVGLEHLDPGVLTVQRWDRPDKVEAQKLRFKPEDVIFGRRRAYQKKVARADFEGICSAHALVLRARPGLIDPSFLPVFVASDYFLDRAIEISVGSLSPTVNWGQLKTQEFVLPPFPEQKPIADVIWAIERHKNALGAVDVALTESQAPLMAVDAESFVTVDDVVTIARSGATPLRANKSFYGGGIPWLKSGEVIGDDITATEESISDAGLARSATWLAPSGSIVVAMYGDGKTRGQVGRLGTPMCTNQAVLALVPDESMADPDFLYYWLRSRQAELRSKGAGAAQKNLSKALVVTEPFPNLSRESQKAAAQKVLALNTARDQAISEATELSRVRSALIAEIFGGN
ncbi:restriction endonuclease subunit S [Microbacterium lacus]|uniref:restriction endonuclease subunit S n=1 Tax=Microbacterium lacus TaxID=415217 RepID=UPI000C2C2C54|nr:restriction endonuclease subunit S [Microbacterium lacus]|tara:strand:+ start:188 stop:1333 length:1146 start_codon:yes stop_codon:yes gene_type:complete